MFAYCGNDPVMYLDCSGERASWNNIKNWVSDKWNKATAFVKKTASVIFTKDFAKNVDDIILNNIEAEAGISIGIGFQEDGQKVNLEAITRMDIIGVQFKDKQLGFGHNGRSALAIGVGPVTIGPQNNTYETFSGEREVEPSTYIDIGWSRGKAAAFVIGYHYNISVSFSGMFHDVMNYVEGHW